MTLPDPSDGTEPTRPIPPPPYTPPPVPPPPPLPPPGSSYQPPPPSSPYQPGAAGGYPQPAQPAQAQPGTNAMAILALICAFVFAPLGIVFGYMAKKQIKQTGEQGEGLANVGLVLGYVFTGLAVLGCCIGVIAIFASANNTSY